MNRVIFNADDFGIHTEVNHAVIEAYEKGVLRSTSLLASGPAFDEAVALAKQCPGLGIGIHLCLVGSLPTILSPREVPTLVDANGLVPESYIPFVKKIMEGQINYEQVYRELDAQMEKIMAQGLNITHVDSHQHMHMLPPIWAIVQTLMKKYGLHRLRVPREPYLFKAFSAGPVRVMGRNGLTFLAHKAMADVKRLRFTTTDYFWGMVDGGNMNVNNLSYILQRMPFGVHEIMMHPGRSTAALSQVFSWGYHWEDELHALLSPTTQELMKERHIEPIHFGMLP